MKLSLNLRGLAIGIGLGFILLATIGCIVGFAYIYSFSKSAQIEPGKLISLLKTGFHNRSEFENKRITFLIVGLDKRDDSLEKTLLTDTLILSSLNTENGKLVMIPIPRDLWIDSLKTKINALYYFGTNKPDSSGSSYLKENVTEITDVPIDYTIILNYNDLVSLVDTLGGVIVTIPRSFADTHYPNPQFVSEGSASAEPVYVTVQFDQGTQKLNGERALAFVRSRHSEDSQEGSDIGRSSRQLLLFQSLIARLKDKNVWQNPQTMGKLYRFFHDHIETNLDDSTLVALGFNLTNKPIVISSRPIPVSDTVTDQSGILVHPSISKYGVWVYEPKDKSWNELKEFIKSNL